MKSYFSASWIKGRPAYWVNGKRVSRPEGYKHALDNNVNLPAEFHDWHNENDKK